MQADYWHQKWSEEKIGFHQEDVNKRLKHYWPVLELPAGAPVFVPLCGKSLDMLWLHQQGHSVLGVELSEKAVKAFYMENELSFDCRQMDGFDVYAGTGKAAGIALLVGDFFNLTPGHVEHCQAYYDRAAMIAMNPELRTRYAAHMGNIMPADSKGLLLTISYDQNLMEGPPFSVDDENARTLLEPQFTVAELAHFSGPKRVGNLSERGLETLEERVYLLTRHRQ